jgi:Zn-dependent peptidase ImmA (M78 family)
MSKPLSGVCADQKYSYRKLESIAAHVREQLNFTDDQAIDPLRLFEDLHCIRIQQGNGRMIPLRGGVIELEDSEGYTWYDGKKKVIEILASARTYKRLEEGRPRAGYFVAHELGHCVLHSDQLVRLAQMPTNQQAAFHRGRIGHKPFEDTEWQANAFAGALLMPARGIAGLEQDYRVVTLSLMMDQFGVSRQAASYRLDLFETRRDELLS